MNEWYFNMKEEDKQLLQDRIQNIKTLLDYCPITTDEVMIINEEVGLFFANFFNSYGNRFKHTPYDHVYPRMFLHKILNKDFKTYSTTIGIDYVYGGDRDGDYGAFCLFNDEDLNDSCFDFCDGDPLIESSEIPDNIWSIIQSVVYQRALEYINEEINRAEKSLKYWKKELKKYLRVTLDIDHKQKINV